MTESDLTGIQRYDLVGSTPWPNKAIGKVKDGGYVKLSDHVSALSDSEALVKELATAIKDYTTVGMLIDPTFPAKYGRLKEVINTPEVRRILEGK